MRNIQKVGIAGAGVMGSAIAQVFAQAGCDVTVYDVNPESLSKIKNVIQRNQRIFLDTGMLTEQTASDSLERIATTEKLADFSAMDLVIECVIEKMDVKQTFFEQLESVVSRDTLLATNTSGLSINGIGARLKDKTRFIGANWWTPAYIIPLVEMVRCDETADETVDSLYETLVRVGKKPVVINREVSGFVGNRMQFALFREALHIVEEGLASPEDVDRVLKYGLGLRYAVLGPFEVADYGGVDTYFHICDSLFADLDTRKDANKIIRSLYQAGDYGIKTGEGFYDYRTADAKQLLRTRDEKLIGILELTK